MRSKVIALAVQRDMAIMEGLERAAVPDEAIVVVLSLSANRR